MDTYQTNIPNIAIQTHSYKYIKLLEINSCDADKLIQIYLRHIKLLMNKSCTEGEI